MITQRIVRDKKTSTSMIITLVKIPINPSMGNCASVASLTFIMVKTNHRSTIQTKAINRLTNCMRLLERTSLIISLETTGFTLAPLKRLLAISTPNWERHSSCMLFCSLLFVSRLVLHRFRLRGPGGKARTIQKCASTRIILPCKQDSINAAGIYWQQRILQSELLLHKE